MTNEEAIKMIKDDVRLHHDHLSGKYRKALRIAIEALSNSQNQTDSELKTKADSVSETDVIYRADAIDAAIKADMENHNGILSEKRARVFEEHIAILPSAQPAQKHGRWIPERLQCTNGGSYQVYRCDQCKEAFNWKMDFCGGCGADMRGENNETD